MTVLRLHSAVRLSFIWEALASFLLIIRSIMSLYVYVNIYIYNICLYVYIHVYILYICVDDSSARQVETLR